jgi:ATP:corrinoid adenosyltransferase
MIAWSDEQKIVIDAYARGESFKVLAAAGVGKTSTLVEACRRSTKGKVWIIEYNRLLREDAEEKVKDMEHVTAYNYDSIMVKYYDSHAPDTGFDVALKTLLDKNTRPIATFDFDTLILDELQDMTSMFFKFINKLIRDRLSEAAGPLQLILIGDLKQMIYGYREATSVFLTGCDDAMFGNIASHSLPTKSINRTRRFGEPLCSLVNELCRPLFEKNEWGEDVDCEPGRTTTVDLFTYDRSRVPTVLAEEITKELVDSSNSVVLLTYSTRTCKDLWHFVENSVTPIVSDRFPHVRTIHTTKGREYGCVIVIWL